MLQICFSSFFSKFVELSSVDLHTRMCVYPLSLSQISDFGMAQRTDIHVPHEGGKFPIKWTAPEALKDSVSHTFIFRRSKHVCTLPWSLLGSIGAQKRRNLPITSDF